jgi:hypothetical protein
MYTTICLWHKNRDVSEMGYISSLESEIPALLWPSANLFSYPFPKCYDFIMMMGKVNTALHSRFLINWVQIIQRLCLENWLAEQEAAALQDKCNSSKLMECDTPEGQSGAPNKLAYFNFLKKLHYTFLFLY